jgi:uncharacterized membrane protein YeiH
MDAQVTVPLSLELAAVFVGALLGGLAAADHDLDILGIATVAIASGLGGGIIRDIILQRHGVAAFSTNSYLLTALVAALLAFFFTQLMHRSKPLLFAMDAVSLGLFAIVGADKALRAGLLIVPAILLGTITAVGGGMLKDSLVGDQSRILKPGTLYGLAAVAAATFFVLAVEVGHAPKSITGVAAVVVAVAIRGLSVQLKWETRPASDLSPWLFAVAQRVHHRARPKNKRLGK